MPDYHFMIIYISNKESLYNTLKLERINLSLC